MLPCCIFSYREDSYEVVLAARSAAMAGLFPVFIVDDENKPISKESRTQLESEGHVVISRSFDRSFGLRGIVALTEVLRTYQWIMTKTGASHIVKLDSDTVLIRSNAIMEAREEDYDLLAWGSLNYAMHGTAYLISNKLVSTILEFINRWKGIPGYANKDVPEDLAIYWMSRLMQGQGIKSKVSVVANGGKLGYLWAWEEPSDFFHKRAEHFDSISFGNRIDSSGIRISKIESYMVMSSFMDFISKWQIPTSSGLQLVV